MIRRTIKWLFTVPEGERTNLSILIWWEKRRIAYNLIVGIVGLCSLLLFYTFIEMSGKLPPGEDAIELLALFLAPFGINVFYTAGWVVELLAINLKPEWGVNLGPRLMKLGIGFSLGVIMIPSSVWGVTVLLQRLHIIA